MEISDRAIQIKAAFSAAIAFGTALFGWVGWVVVIWLFSAGLVTGTFMMRNKYKKMLDSPRHLC